MREPLAVGGGVCRHESRSRGVELDEFDWLECTLKCDEVIGWRRTVVSFGTQAPGLNDSASAEAIRVRHESWAKALPKESADLWDALQEWDGDSQAGLFAHIVSLSVNAVYEPWNRRPRAAAHADRLAQSVDLDIGDVDLSFDT